MASEDLSQSLREGKLQALSKTAANFNSQVDKVPQAVSSSTAIQISFACTHYSKLRSLISDVMKKGKLSLIEFE